MCTILMVEDEQLIVDMVSDYLQLKGYKVYAAYDGKEAIKKYIQYNKEVDLILLGYNDT